MSSWAPFSLNSLVVTVMEMDLRRTSKRERYRAGQDVSNLEADL
jgi:hypothetical protein